MFITAFSFLRFYYLRERAQQGNRGDGQREREKQTPLEQGAQCGVQSQDSGIMT